MNQLAANIAEYTVSELSFALKRSVEENFEHVRVRGEVSGFKGVTVLGSGDSLRRPSEVGSNGALCSSGLGRDTLPEILPPHESLGQALVGSTDDSSL